MRIALLLLLATATASGAEVAIQDSCNGGVCLTGLRWKKGVIEHTLSGFVGPESGKAQSLSITFSYTDGRNNGRGVLNLKDAGPHTPFYFKVHWRSVKWDESSVTVSASAVLGIEPVQKGGIACRFSSLGSRLAVQITNSTDKDLILDYQLLTLTAGGKNHRLNGNRGKYTDLATPNAPSLIGAGTEQKEEFIPVGSATFQDGQWSEDWLIHATLMQERPTLTLPLGADRLEKIPLEVRFADVSASGAVTPKAK